MKKESVKKQIETLLGTSEEVFQSKGVSDFKVTSGNFKGWYAAKIDDEENRREMEEHLRKRAAAVARGHVISRAEVERRSNNFQKALAYIGEHRHLIPFLRFLDDYVRSHEGKSEYDAIREYKKNNQLPPELYHEGYGIYSFGPKMPHISIFLEQLPVLPKAWLQ